MDAQSTSSSQIRWLADGEAGTERLAKALAPHLAAGDVILLDGALAAGKTHLVKALVAALGCPDVVTSPTYALVHIYKAPRVLVVHVDAYRLQSLAEYRDLGLADYAEDAIMMIEWGSKVAADHAGALRIDIGFVEGEPQRRAITLAFPNARWQRLAPTITEKITD